MNPSSFNWLVSFQTVCDFCSDYFCQQLSEMLKTCNQNVYLTNPVHSYFDHSSVSWFREERASGANRSWPDDSVAVEFICFWSWIQFTVCSQFCPFLIQLSVFGWPHSPQTHCHNSSQERFLSEALALALAFSLLQYRDKKRHSLSTDNSALRSLQSFCSVLLNCVVSSSYNAFSRGCIWALQFLFISLLHLAPSFWVLLFKLK